MSDIAPLLEDKQTSDGRVKYDASDRSATWTAWIFAAQIDLFPAVANQDAVSKVGSTLYVLDG
jgi:hypothetical protein